jgi:hypothetical protein
LRVCLQLGESARHAGEPELMKLIDGGMGLGRVKIGAAGYQVVVVIGIGDFRRGQTPLGI